MTSGASSDLMQATNMARAMVTKYGFSDEIGKVYHAGGAGEEQSSGQTRVKIDNEVKRILDASYTRATKLLKENGKKHHMLAKALIEYETLTGDECRDIVKKGKLPRREKENVKGGEKGDVKGVLGKGFGIGKGIKG